MMRRLSLTPNNKRACCSSLRAHPEQTLLHHTRQHVRGHPGGLLMPSLWTVSGGKPCPHELLYFFKVAKHRLEN